MEAAVGFLASADRKCPVDMAKIALVGASNGTTSVLDYTLAHDSGLPDPVAVTWMSPGAYTEAQHPIADHRDTLDGVPIQWLYPDNEPYSEAFINGAPADWEFTERGSVHGTQMFDEGELESATVTDMTAWLERFAK